MIEFLLEQLPGICIGGAIVFLGICVHRLIELRRPKCDISIAQARARRAAKRQR